MIQSRPWLVLLSPDQSLYWKVFRVSYLYTLQYYEITAALYLLRELNLFIHVYLLHRHTVRTGDIKMVCWIRRAPICFANSVAVGIMCLLQVPVCQILQLLHTACILSVTFQSDMQGHASKLTIKLFLLFTTHTTIALSD